MALDELGVGVGPGDAAEQVTAAAHEAPAGAPEPPAAEVTRAPAEDAARAPAEDAAGAPAEDAARAPAEDAAGAPAEDAAPPALTPTGRVILGMIGVGKQTGYDIKQLVDKSTRHFWAASYGQIYPELRRLEEQRLVRGRPEPSGGRARTVYELTDAGERALTDWLRSDVEPVFELRNEGMLKLFFSELAPETRIESIRAMRVLYERKRAELRLLEAKAAHMPTGPRLTLEMGLDLMASLIAWCEAAERELGPAADRPIELPKE